MSAENTIIVAFVALLLSSVVALTIATIVDNNSHARLMKQCLADGRKEYECVSLLRQNSTTVVPMPVITPMPMGR